jgi:hypothetical protein
MSEAERQYIDRLADRDYMRQLLEVVHLAIGMRRLQRLYFRSLHGTKQRKEALQHAMIAEKLFDEAVAKLKAPALDLGGQHQ